MDETVGVPQFQEDPHMCIFHVSMFNTVQVKKKMNTCHDIHIAMESLLPLSRCQTTPAGLESPSGGPLRPRHPLHPIRHVGWDGHGG